MKGDRCVVPRPNPQIVTPRFQRECNLPLLKMGLTVVIDARAGLREHMRATIRTLVQAVIIEAEGRGQSDVP